MAKNTVDIDNLKSLSMVILVPTFLLGTAIGGAFILGMRMGKDSVVVHEAEGCACGCADFKNAERDRRR